MTNPKYASVEHREQRAYWAPIVDAGQAMCAEPVCLERHRRIEPGTPWDVSHTPDGLSYIGASHARCNRSEAARRGNSQRGSAKTPTLWWQP